MSWLADKAGELCCKGRQGEPILPGKPWVLQARQGCLLLRPGLAQAKLRLPEQPPRQRRMSAWWAQPRRLLCLKELARRNRSAPVAQACRLRAGPDPHLLRVQAQRWEALVFPLLLRALRLRRRSLPPQFTGLGGLVGLHGGGWGSDWTWGCVALDNPGIEELWIACPLGTPVEIVA